MTSPGGKEVGRISIRVVPDTSKFREELRAQLEEIEKSSKVKIKVELDLDTDGLREKLDAETAGAKQIKIKPDIDLGDSIAKIEALRTALGKDTKLKVKVDVDDNPVKNELAKIGSGGAGGFSGGGSGIGALGGQTALIAAAVLALGAPAAALLSGALATLPALLSAVAVPMAAVLLGLDGLKNAVKVLQPDFDALKKTMSTKFQDVFTPIFTELKSVFPALEQSLPGVADSIGVVAKSLVDTVTSATGLDRIKGIIGSISQTIATSAPGVTAFGDGLLNLANGVAAKFPAVATWFDTVGQSFDNWVKKQSVIGADGKSPLDTAMSNLGQTLKGIGDIGGDILDQGFKWLADPKFGQSMKDFVSDTKTLVDDVLPGLGHFFQDVAGALHDTVAILDKIDKFKPPSWLPQGNQDAPDATQNPNVTHANSFFPGVDKGSWLDKLLDGDPGDKGGLVGLNLGLPPNFFDKLTTGFVGAFTKVWPTIESAAQAAWTNIASAAKTAWDGIVSAAQTALSGIGNFLSSIPGTLSSAWSSLGGIASGLWSSVVSAVAGAMANAVTAVASGAANIVAEAAAIPGKIAGAMGNLGGILVAAGKALMNGLLSGIKQGLADVLVFAGTVAAKIAAVKGPISVDKTILTPNGQALMQGLQDGIEGGLQGVLSRAGQIAGQINDAISNGSSGVNLGTLPDQLKQSISELGIEGKTLQVQLDAIPKTKDTKGQRQELEDEKGKVKALQDQLGLQSEQLGYSKKYGDQTSDNNKLLSDSVDRTVSIGKNFAQANVGQLEQDLGISGNGAIPTLANSGVDFLTTFLSSLLKGGLQTHIHVNSVDDALAAKQTIQNKQALQYTGR